MKKNIFFALILIISASLFSCKKDPAVNNEQPTATSNLQQKNNVLKRNINVPFKGNFTVTAKVWQGPPILKQTISGTGNATYLGKSTFVSNVSVNLTTPPPFQVNGTATFTSAGGDQFFTNVSGTSIPANGGTHAEIVHTITGGTGMFENVSGTLNAITDNGVVNFDGQISF